MHHCHPILLTAGISAAFTASAAAVPFSYSENFEGGSIPSGYSVPIGSFNVQSTTATAGSLALVSTAGGTGQERADYLGTSTEGISATDWQDYTVTGTIGADTWTDGSSSLYAGVLVRVQSDGSAYGFRVGNTANAAPQLIRVENLPSTPGPSSIFSLAVSGDSTTTMDAGEEFSYVFSVVNDEVNGEVDLSVAITTADGAVLDVSTSVAYTDPNVIADAGYFSLFTESNNTRLWAFDDLNITGDAVPEPSGLAFMELAAVGLLARRRA